MIDRSALVRDTFESSKSFEMKEEKTQKVQVVPCEVYSRVVGG